MPRRLLITALMSTGLLATAIAAQQTPTASPAVPAGVVARAADAAPESRVEAEQAMDAAVAAALIGAISEQFGERRIDVKLQRLDSTAVNLIDSRLTGVGELRLGPDSDWIPMQFSALYDSVGTVVMHPKLTIGRDSTPVQALQSDSALARSLGDEVQRRLNSEFGDQHVALTLSDVQLRPLNDRFSRLHANGLAGFDGEGSAQAAIQAVYDNHTREWVQVNYELGASSTSISDVQGLAEHDIAPPAA